MVFPSTPADLPDPEAKVLLYRAPRVLSAACQGRQQGVGSCAAQAVAAGGQAGAGRPCDQLHGDALHLRGCMPCRGRREALLTEGCSMKRCLGHCAEHAEPDLPDGSSRLGSSRSMAARLSGCGACSSASMSVAGRGGPDWLSVPGNGDVCAHAGYLL